MSATATKVMSLSSTSGAPTPPHPTPCTEASPGHEDAAQPDFDSLTRLLVPIQEDLNEQAEVAMLPSPPINTPEAFSPAPSVHRGPVTRVRGFSVLGDRLAQLKLHNTNFPRKDSDCASSSRSVVTSVGEDDGENVEDDISSTGRSSGHFSSPNHIRHKSLVSPSLLSPTPGAIPIALGSARLNPRIEEYVHFSSKDLPVAGPAKVATSSTQAVPVNDGAHTRAGSFDTVKAEGGRNGVTEKSTWAEEVEDAAERVLLRLEQLALDECTINPERTLQDYYKKRLQRLLSAGSRKVKLNVTFEDDSESSGSSTPSDTTTTEALPEIPEDLTQGPTAEVVEEAAKE